MSKNVFQYKVLCVIPARSGSKGLPGKNKMMFCGKPLLAWSVEQSLSCQYVDTTVVSSDDPETIEIARNYGAEVPFIRPIELSTDEASSIDVVLHAIDYYKKERDIHFELVVLLEPTSPLRDCSDIDRAIEQLRVHPVARSIVGVTKAECSHPAFMAYMQDGLLKPYRGNFQAVRRQDIETLYYFEGSVYASYIDTLVERRAFYHDLTLGYSVPKHKAIEIDDQYDFIMAQSLMQAKLEGKII